MPVYGGQNLVDKPDVPLAAVLRQEHAFRNLNEILMMQTTSEGRSYREVWGSAPTHDKQETS